MSPYISVIIPAHNEAARITATLEAVRDYLYYRCRDSEIIVVENGSSDNTAALVMEYIAAHSPWPAVKLIRRDVGDKGRAVKAGMLAAGGDYRYMADADLSTPIDQLGYFILLARGSGADLVIGNRMLISNQTKTREILSNGFNAAANITLGRIYSDTQAGFKLFTASAAESLFSRLKVFGWAFDVEILLIAQQQGLKVVELPITWRREPGSKIRAGDPFKMLADLARIKLAHAPH